MPVKEASAVVQVSSKVSSNIMKPEQAVGRTSRSFEDALKAAGAEAFEGKSRIAPSNTIANTKPVRGLLNKVISDTAHLDKVMNGLLEGKSLNQHELLYLQAFSYKVTLATELVSKTAETASQAVKTTMQTQV